MTPVMPFEPVQAARIRVVETTQITSITRPEMGALETARSYRSGVAKGPEFYDGHVGLLFIHSKKSLICDAGHLFPGGIVPADT